MTDPIEADVVVIGSGAAGLTVALNLAAGGRQVLVLSKAAINAGSTSRAQGGIAAVLDAGDTFESHIEDTMVAGAGLNDRRAVEYVVEHAAPAIERLAALGVPFTPGETPLERWHLTREGGHSARRIVHVDDATGLAVHKALERAALQHPLIRFLPDQVAIDLITDRHIDGGGYRPRRAMGLYAIDRASGHVRRLLGKAVVLVPSPNVAEDHQTKNAQALVNKDAAVMVSDVLASGLLFDVALSLVRDDDRLERLKRNITVLAQHDSAKRIVDEIEKIISAKHL